jgi:hypothetical protein
MALNYGRRTPISVILADLLYGGILGAFYRLNDQLPVAVSQRQRGLSPRSQRSRTDTVYLNEVG